jgi:hypothetical protein
MALDFGILQPVNIGGNIMAGQQEAQRNQLAQQQLAANQQQMQTGALQQQKAELELADFKRRQTALDTFVQQAKQNGKTGSEEDLANNYYEYALNTGDPQHIMHAQELLMGVNERKAYMGSRQPPKISPVAPPAGAMGSGTYGMDQNVPMFNQPNAPSISLATPVRPQTLSAAMINPQMVNQLTSAAAAPVNQLAMPVGMSPAEIQAKIIDLSNRYPRGAAKGEIAMLTKQLEEASKTHVVGRNLVTGSGQPIFTAPQDVTPSDIKRLTSERDALPIGHPNRKLYDQAIADIGAQQRLAQERLNFDRSKFAWEKANPGYTIQQAEDGSIVGVNNRSLQAFPVNLNAAPPPSPAPFAGGAGGAPGGAGKRGGAMAPIAEPIIQPRGEPLKGKTAGLTESQGNATAFGMRMKDSHSILKDLESKGETNTGLIRGTVGGTVGLVPFIGDKLAGATDNIFNVLPSILGGMSPEQQQIQNSRINFITAVLRKESGASIAPSEFAMAEKLYFPQPGNDASVIKQKQRARELAIKAMEIQAGSGAKSIQSLTPGASNATSASDPLGLFNK